MIQVSVEPLTEGRGFDPAGTIILVCFSSRAPNVLPCFHEIKLFSVKKRYLMVLFSKKFMRILLE